MRLSKIGIAILLVAGIGSACGGQPAEPTAVPSTATLIPTSAPTETAAPTATIPPTETPTVELTRAAAGISFANDIYPILESRCLNCHGGERVEEGLVMRSYADIMAGSDNGPVVVPGDSANSQMAILLLNNKMPKRGPKLTPPQVQLIVDWIDQGALNN
ncbi:MAG: hypothetical protein FJZ87_05160 [Chloroflexi bacterium]|nr:hypothetical protein [Chloroflexota bacterium]